MSLRGPLVVALLVLLAGCSAPLGGTPATDAPAETERPATDSPSPTTGNDPTPTGTDAEPTATPTESPESTRTSTATPTATATATPTPDPSNPERYAVRIRNGELPIDANRTFARVVTLLDVSVAAPRSITIDDPEEATISGTTAVAPEPVRILGVVYEGGTDGNGSSQPMYAGQARSGDDIRINRLLLDDPKSLEETLAHEYVHAVQFRTGAFSEIRGGFSIDRPRNLDASFVFRGVIEGAASYTEEVYENRYLRETPHEGDRYADYVKLNDTGRQYLLAPYVYGNRYFDRRVDSPANVSAVYERPPRTTEQLIHGYGPEEEPIANLSLASGDDGWYESTVPIQGGELTTRLVLRSELNDSLTVAGADGWGNDRLAGYSPKSGPEKTGYAWVHRWDDAANATEFVDVFRRYLSDRATRDGDLWRTEDGITFRVVRTGDRTTAVLYGDEAFVRNASVSGTSNVTVTVP